MDENNIDAKIELKKLSKGKKEEIMNVISTNSGCGPHFLEAYCKVADKELEKMKETHKKMKEQMTIKYIHPGTYREFIL